MTPIIHPQRIHKILVILTVFRYLSVYKAGCCEYIPTFSEVDKSIFGINRYAISMAIPTATTLTMGRKLKHNPKVPQHHFETLLRASVLASVINCAEEQSIECFMRPCCYLSTIISEILAVIRTTLLPNPDVTEKRLFFWR